MDLSGFRTLLDRSGRKARLGNHNAAAPARPRTPAAAAGAWDGELAQLAADGVTDALERASWNAIAAVDGAARSPD